MAGARPIRGSRRRTSIRTAHWSSKDPRQGDRRREEVPPAQLVLAWLLAQGDDVTAIPGTRYPARLDENLGALKVTLSAEDVARIDAAVPTGAAAGTRYPAGGMSGVFI